MAIWIIHMILSIAFLLFFIIFSYLQQKKDRAHTRLHFYFRFQYYLILGVLLSAFFLTIPIQYQKQYETGNRFIRVLSSSFVYSLQMFTINADYNVALSEFSYPSPFIGLIHSSLLTIEFAVAPILTLTTVLSLFRNLTDEYRFWQRRNRDTYVFSELNEQSLALAKSIHDRDPKACLAFAGVKTDYESDAQNPLIREVEGIGGLLLKTEILSLGLKNRKPFKLKAAIFRHPQPSARLDIYLISKNESDNVVQAVTLKEQLNSRNKCRIFVFSTRPECEYLIAEKPDQKGTEKPENIDDRFMIRKINPILSLVYRNLYDKGYELLFDQASVQSSKKISVILVGLGQYGLEMLKAVPWFCQMDGYRFEINAFDKDKNAQKKVEAACPELFKAQNDPHKGTLLYDVHIHPDTDTDSVDFSNALINIENPTYILVALGEDAQNIRTAINIRILYKQNKADPKIQTIVYNPQECDVLKFNPSFKDKFNIGFIGDLNSSCKENVLINSELENDGLSIHMEYSPDQVDSFYASDYNYRSSCASAIHTRVVARFLKNYKINQEFLRNVESWLKTAFYFNNRTISEDQSDFIKDLISWAHRMSDFAKKQTKIEPFTFAEWIKKQSNKSGSADNDSIKDLKTLSFDPEAKVNAQYCFQNQHVTIKEEENEYDYPVIVSGTDNREDLYEPEKVSAYILLAMKLMKLEHDRWCAYMRTEGFRYSAKKDTAFKMHSDLVSYKNLPDREKPKDLHLDLLFQQLDSFLFNEAEVYADPSIPSEPDLTTDPPEDIESEVVIQDIPESERICDVYSEQMERIGEDIIRRLKNRSGNCQQNSADTPVVEDKKNPPVNPASNTDAEVISYLAIEKYVMYSSLYRIERQWNRIGISLSRQTMSNWLLKASKQWLEPIWNLMHQKLVKEEILHADETILQVLKEPGQNEQTTSCMWLYRTGREAKQQLVLYEYQKTRGAKHLITFLKEFVGYLHTDLYAEFNECPQGIKVVGCLAHARHKFEEALKALPESDRKDSKEQRGVGYYDKLFHIEEQIKDLSPEERKQKREELAKPILDELHNWTLQLNADPESLLGKAALYTQEQWNWLNGYLKDGRLEISNIRAKRSIKPFVMSGKNFMFANTPNGAKASAIYFSLIETAKENGLDPYRYLTWVLKTAPKLKEQNKSDEPFVNLLPVSAPKECRMRGKKQ